MSVVVPDIGFSSSHAERDWTAPLIRWGPGRDSLAQHRWLREAGQLLTTWQPAPFEETATDCFKVGDEFWIWQPRVGGIRFAADAPECTAYPDPGVERSWFEDQLARSWLPAVYLVWGRQVLHASAAARKADGAVVAFIGPSGAGKSTIAYALSTRPGWQHVSDDTLAFSPGESGIGLHPLRNDARLRPATAAHFGKAGADPEPLEWPRMPLKLVRAYLLKPEAAGSEAIRLEPLSAPASYLGLLEQAHAFTLEVARHNQRLMRDYLHVAATIPVFRLTYRRRFEDLGRIIDAVEAHTDR